MATILVVDDNAINRKLLVALLSGDGHLTHEACDGVDGLTVAHARRPQLIISDILMPTMDGYGFVRALRQDATLRGTPVIFYTAHYHEREAQNLAQALGVSRVLIKPCPNAEILKAVEQTMAGVAETQPQVLSDAFDQEHLRLVTNKLAERADALAASNARFAALAELNLEIASESNPRALLERACAGARRLLGSHYAVLTIAEETTKGLFFTTSGIDSGIPLIAPDLHAGALGRVLTQRMPWRSCRAEGALEEPGFPLGYPSAKAYLAVPLMTPARVYGWLCMGNKIGAECFDASDERLLQTLSAAVAKYYENNRLHAELQRQTVKLHRAYATLGGVNALIAQARDHESVCREACRLSVERGRFRLAYIEVAGPGETATCIAAAGERLDTDRFAWHKPRDRSQHDDLVEATVNTDAAGICNDLFATQLQVTQRRELLERGFRAIAVLPLSGNPAGRLVLLSEHAGIFDDSELRLLNEFAGGVALALAQVHELSVAG